MAGSRLSTEMTAATFRQRDSRMYDPENLARSEPQNDPVVFRVGLNTLRHYLAERRQAAVRTELGRLSSSG